jgi:hypothetical protein
MAVTSAAAADTKNKKLTKVISTKLSVQDYNLFQILTNLAYQHGEIKLSAGIVYTMIRRRIQRKR